jgi:hypothetical protein
MHYIPEVKQVVEVSRQVLISRPVGPAGRATGLGGNGRVGKRGCVGWGVCCMPSGLALWSYAVWTWATVGWSSSRRAVPLNTGFTLWASLAAAGQNR